VAIYATTLLIGLTVVDVPGITAPMPGSLGSSHYVQERAEQLLADARARTAGYAEAFAQQAEMAGVPYHVLALEGDPAEVIVGHLADVDVSLFGQQTFFRFETSPDDGDLLDDWLRQVRRPIVTVPQTLPTGDAIVLAYDAEPPAVRALEAFVQHGRAGTSPVHVVSVDGQVATAQRRADEAVRYLTAHGLTAYAHALTGEVEAAILDQIQQTQARMLVMGAHGQSSVWEFFFGSQTEELRAHTRNLCLFLHH
jgi:nucleotide-binding universal stress UspA family protein